MEMEPSFEFENLVYTPSDAGFPFHSPSPDLPPVQPSHMSIDQLQPQQEDPRPCVAAMELESSFELDNLVSTPIDAGFPFPCPSSNLSPAQPSHMSIDQLQPQQGDSRPCVAAMELEPSLEVGNFVSTPSEAEFPLPSPSSDLLPVQPSHITIPVAERPYRSSNPTDLELVESLRPLVQASGFPHGSQKKRFIVRKDVANNPALVNAGLPLMNPSELPEILQGKRQMYYRTDCHQLCYNFVGDLKTPNGFWRQIGSGSPICDTQGPGFEIAGFRRTYAFYFWKDPSLCVEVVDSNWVMKVYSVMNNAFREDELVLCHVFEGKVEKQWRTCRDGPRTLGKAKPCILWAADAPANTPLFQSKLQGLLPMHHGPFRSGEPKLLTSYMSMLEGVLLGDSDPVPNSSMETGYYMPTRDASPTGDPGKSHKGKRTSIAWDYFTKIYARDLEGYVVTLAVCNHCSTVLTADSKNGTRHLLNHTCPCKFKPVQAGKDKGVVNVLSCQASSACS